METQQTTGETRIDGKELFRHFPLPNLSLFLSSWPKIEYILADVVRATTTFMLFNLSVSIIRRCCSVDLCEMKSTYSGISEF